MIRLSFGAEKGKKNMEQLLEILRELHPDVDFEKETSLVTGGILDSFSIVNLVAELNDAYDIEITASDLMVENFDSAAAILALVERLQDE